MTRNCKKTFFDTLIYVLTTLHVLTTGFNLFIEYNMYNDWYINKKTMIYQIIKIHTFLSHYEHQDITMNNLPSCFSHACDIQIIDSNIITCVLHAYDNSYICLLIKICKCNIRFNYDSNLFFIME